MDLMKLIFHSNRWLQSNASLKFLGHLSDVDEILKLPDFAYVYLRYLELQNNRHGM